jgi:hypothetical protein
MTGRPSAAIIFGMPLPPTPPDLALDISSAVAIRVQVDIPGIRARLADELRTSDGNNSLIEAERLARAAIDPHWDALAPSCELALADVHERYLAAAAQVLEAGEDLRTRGPTSWIAGAVLHRVAFDLAWQALDDCGLLIDLDYELAGEGVTEGAASAEPRPHD